MKWAGLIPVGLALGASVVGLGLIAKPAPQFQRIAEYATPLAGRTPAQRHNALLAMRHLGEVEVEPYGVFSFNQSVGSWSRDRGYLRAPVSYNGQLLIDWGGGVCQTSTTVYNAGLLAGLVPLERHPHRFAPAYCPPGRDAAVAFSAVDLRFANPHPFPIRVRGRAIRDRLYVEILATQPLAERPRLHQEIQRVYAPDDFGPRSAGHSRIRVRNSGKYGFNVTTYRITGDRREQIAVDTYPAMNRIFEAAE